MLRKGMAVLLGAVVGTLAFAGTAQATDDPAFEHGYPEVTASPSDVCGEVKLTFTNPTPWLFVFDVRVDGEDAPNPSVAPDVTIEEGPLAGQLFGPRWELVEVDGSASVHEVVKTFEFSESVEVRLAEGAEQKLYFDWQSIEVESSICPPPVELCEWNREIPADHDDCQEPTTPGPETPSPSASPSSSPEPAIPGQAGGADQLPLTGAKLPLLLGGAAVMIGLGAGLYLLTRKRGPKFTS